MGIYDALIASNYSQLYIMLSKTGYIYLIENLIDEQETVYVGSTNCLKRRWHEHRKLLRGNKHFNSYLQRAWNKYGEDNFVFSILESLEHEKDLSEREQYWLDFFLFSGQKVYNMAKYTYSPMRGRKHTEEAKRKMSKAHKGKIPWIQGKTHTPETRRKMSLARKGKKWSEERRRKRSKVWGGKKNPFWGKKHTPETRQKISESLKKKGLIGPRNPRYGILPSKECIEKCVAATSKSYPALYNERTGNFIPAGKNISELCREKGFHRAGIGRIFYGKRRHYKGWILAGSISD